MGLFSCVGEIIGSGAVSTQTYTPVSNFTKVSVDHNIDVLITYGTTKKVHVTGYDNLLEHIKISATGGTLRIGMKDENTYQNMNVTATVVMPGFTELIVTHEGNITVDTLYPSNVPNLTLRSEGSGNIEFISDLSIGTLNAYMNNTGSIEISGLVMDQTILMSGSGDYHAFDLRSNNSTVDLSGSGNAEVNVKMLLNAIISGSGNISYKRYPSINSTLTGTGLLIDAN